MTIKLTGGGKNLLLRALLGEGIIFTRMQLGDGAKQDAGGATTLLSPRLSVELTDIAIGDMYATLTAAFNNSTVTSGFRVTEVGYFAKDPDNEGKELLYALGQEEADQADFIPDSSSRVLEMEISHLVFVGDAENISAAINGSLSYATAADFNAHVNNKSNPHAVTKEQVGLGLVPNVSTNDQTPVYSTPSALETLISGEKLSTAFGKIKLAVSSLINHLLNKSNPHGVTAEQVNASAKSHTHSTSDLTAGTLPLERGGTGSSSFSSGALIAGSSDGARLSGMRGIGALFSLSVGKPQFGTLPLEMGGTGVTSLEALKAAVSSPCYVIGHYVGNGTRARIISLGFYPTAVMVLYPKNPFGGSVSTGNYSGIATRLYNGIVYGKSISTNYLSATTYSELYNTVHLVSDGFMVSSDPSATDGSAEIDTHTNVAAVPYIYIAFK